MERIASFTVDHNKLLPGLYLSRRDGDIVTLDLRFKRPNTGDLLSNSEMHSAEHLIATLLRNSPQKEAVIYFGPMGCQTGFYFLFDSRLLDLAGAVELVKAVCPGRRVPGRNARQERRGMRKLCQSRSGHRQGGLPLLRGIDPELDRGAAGLRLTGRGPF